MQSKAFFDRVPFQVGIFDIGPKMLKNAKNRYDLVLILLEYFKVIKVDVSFRNVKSVRK